MKFRVENGEVFQKKWWFSKEISLKNVTHIIKNYKILDRFYEGEKCIYQCQWSVKSTELVDAVFEQTACQYIEFPVFEDNYEMIDVSEQSKFYKSKDWKDMFKQDLKLLDRVVAKYKDLFNTKIIE